MVIIKRDATDHVETTKSLSVCMLVTDLDAPTGGVQRNSRLLLGEFNKRGLATFVCARNYYGLEGDETKDGTVYHRSPVFGSSRSLNGVLYMIDTFLWLVLNRSKYDVLHCQQMFGPTMVAAVVGYFTGKPIVTRTTLSGETGEAAAIRELPFASVRLRLIKRVTKWIALTSEMKRELETLDIPANKIKIIYNGTEIPESGAFDADARGKMRADLGLEYPHIVVFSGRLSKEKNLDVLLNAWKLVCDQVPESHLLLLGEGGSYRSVEEEVREQARKLNIDDNVHFLGHVPNAKDYLIASDLFVLPTVAEGMSNSLVEAFACGTAIVATNIPANSEICEDGVNSILVPVADVGRLADAIINVLLSPELAASMAKAARNKAEQALSLDKMVESYIDTYREVIEGDGKA
ncbi:MAG: glycosyltransferase family 4 protein [Pyrinomonadaceae bacterium]